ncbi:hypothetical protein D3C80_1893440 [compost metagenome]
MIPFSNSAESGRQILGVPQANEDIEVSPKLSIMTFLTNDVKKLEGVEPQFPL